MRFELRFLKWLVVPALGYVALVLPVIISPPPQHYGSVLFQTYTDAVYALSWPSVVLFLLLGFGLGLFTSEREGLSGCLSIIVFPALAIIEMLKDPTSHNLFPFEFINYAMLGAVVVIGSLIGRRVRNVRRGEP